MENSVSAIPESKQDKNISGEDHQKIKTMRVNIPADSSVDIEFSDITLTVSEGFISRKKKTILKGVSGLFKSGHVTAIMGPSGAGKSSLMNALTGFSTQGVTGRIRAGDSVCEFNNRANMLQSLKSYRSKSCYILQDDRLNPLFTVSELMKFAADMKLGQKLSDKMKFNIIRDILESFGLSQTQNTRCGNLSGGQRKRLSIAVELIDNPPVVFLDEPTTGLDSLSTMQCIEMMKNLAHGGRTIICTIHQPSASVYSMFDQVYILAAGMCIYDGLSENTVPHLASFGLFCPKYHNPADYILEIATGEYGAFNDVLAKNCTYQDREETAVKLFNAKTANFHRKRDILPPNEFYKFSILLKRSFIQLSRDWTVTHLKVLVHIMIGILLGLLYKDAGNDASKTISNVGYFLISCVYLSYTSMMPAVLRFPLELPVLKKENFNNWYSLKTYYAAVLVTGIPIQHGKMTALYRMVSTVQSKNNGDHRVTHYPSPVAAAMPACEELDLHRLIPKRDPRKRITMTGFFAIYMIWYSVVYAAPSYLLSGQPMEINRFAMFVLALTGATVNADAVGNVIGSSLNPVNGTFVGAITTCTLLIFAGFLVLFSHMGPVMRVVSYMSFLRQTFEALVLSIYSYGRQNLSCPESITYCHIKNPKDVIKLFDLKSDNYWIDITVLLIEMIIFRIIAYYTLRRTVRHSS